MGTLEDLLIENAALRAEQANAITLKTNKSKTTLYVWCVVFLCLLTAAFVVIITIVRPTSDNQPIILSVLGVIVPVIMALLGAALKQVNEAVDGRLTQLLLLTAKSSKAEGHLAGLMTPTVGVEDARLAEGKAIGVEQERARSEHVVPEKPPSVGV